MFNVSQENYRLLLVKCIKRTYKGHFAVGEAPSQLVEISEVPLKRFQRSYYFYSVLRT